jgi:ribosomal-protein-alanine N-acetyltransferase
MDNPEGVFLSHADISDLPDIMELERMGFDSAIVEAESVFRERLELFPQGLFVLRKSGRRGALGYYCAELWGDGPSVAEYANAFRLGHSARERFDSGGHVLYSASMCLHPDCRGSGMGRFLFESARLSVLSDCQSVDAELLIVDERWSSARSIYRDAGFVESGTLENFFASALGARSDAIVMSRSAIPPRRTLRSST